MKKIFLFILVFVIGFYCVSFNTVYAYTDTVEEYQVNAPDWSNDEFINYYLENQILPASAPSGTENRIFSHSNGIQNHLKGRFSGFDTWEIDYDKSNDVSEKFKGNPIDADEEDPVIDYAKSNSDISGYDAIGCGPLALFTQLDFFARYAGYTQFMTYPDHVIHKSNLAIDIFNTVNTYPAEGFWGQLLESLGIEIDSGTFTFPHDFVAGAQKLFIDYDINTGIGVEDVNPDGTYTQNMKISGDLIPSTASHSSKIARLKKSIDEGMPVVWWTTSGAGDFKNHYMNIFGYEMWKSKDSSGNTKEHLMFKLRINWGWADVYMDSDLLDAVNGGFILFEEQTERIFITPDEYQFPQQYAFVPSLPITLNIFDNSVTINRLRTGYINETGFAGTGNWHITMSARRVGAGTAYLEYSVEKPINYVYFDVRKWGTTEGINENNSTAGIEYKNLNGEWIEAVNFHEAQQSMNGFSHLKDFPDKYRVDFPYGTTDFRFIVTANNPTNSTTNSGRVVIGTVGIVFDSNDITDSDLYVTIFSDNDGGSSSFNFSGHAWIEVYNNSPYQIMIGKYLLPAFEAVTLGTYGNKSHTGLYYNLEYYYYLTVTESSSGSSSYSSSSSSGSGGSFIVGYANGRVSLTEVISVGYASTLTSVINANDQWNLFDNCTHFAIDVWNSVADDDLTKQTILTPTNVIDQINDRDNYQVNRNIFGNSNRVGYYSGYNFVHSTT